MRREEDFYIYGNLWFFMSKKHALKHIDALFVSMREQMHKDTALADEYVGHIRALAMSQRIHLDAEKKRSFCKHCYKVFIPSKTCRVRLQGKKIVYYCFSCKKYTRIPYK